MTVLIRNPSGNPITLPFPFRGVLRAGAGITIGLTLAQVRAALGDLTTSLELTELQTADGNLFARGIYTAIVAEAGATRLISASDAFMQIRCSQACVVTFPAGLSFEPGVTSISFTQGGAGQITLAAGAGVTLNTSETLKSKKQYATIAALYIGTNEWDVVGEREAAA